MRNDDKLLFKVTFPALAQSLVSVTITKNCNVIIKLFSIKNNTKNNDIKNNEKVTFNNPEKYHVPNSAKLHIEFIFLVLKYTDKTVELSQIKLPSNLIIDAHRHLRKILMMVINILKFI